MPDIDIWSAVFELVSTTSPKPTVPPTTFEKADFDRPLRSSSASQRGIEQTHDEVDQRILEELTGRGGFVQASGYSLTSVADVRAICLHLKYGAGCLIADMSKIIFDSSMSISTRHYFGLVELS